MCESLETRTPLLPVNALNFSEHCFTRLYRKESYQSSSQYLTSTNAVLGNVECLLFPSEHLSRDQIRSWKKGRKSE
jgi:hypothetical protein